MVVASGAELYLRFLHLLAQYVAWINEFRLVVHDTK